MKVIFFGSSNYCIPILESINNNFNLVAIITKKDQVVENFAQSHNIKAYTPANKEELINLQNDISSLIPDLAIVADYGIIIPTEIFSIPLYQTLNIHFSLLPKFRGPSPVQYTILMGEKSAWISVIIMDADMDTGDILWTKEVKLQGNETSESLYKYLFDIATFALPEVINQYVHNELKPQKQIHSDASYTKHFTRQDGFIPASILERAIKGINPDQKKLDQWSLSAIQIPLSDTNASDRLHPYQLARLIDCACRALSPWPGLWTTIQITDNKQQTTKRLKILKAHIEIPKPYTLNPIPFLIPDLVQLEGKKTVSWKQFREGHLNTIG